MLTLFDQTASPIKIQSLQLGTTDKEKDPTQVFVNFQVALAEYTLIETKALFNLQPELRGPFLKGDFLPAHTIQIKAALHPDHLPDFLQNPDSSEAAINHLKKLSAQHQGLAQPSPETIDPLLRTENWLALTVKQIRDDGETGYSTFWDYLDLDHLPTPEGNTEQIAEGITQFFQDWTESHLTAATQEMTEGLFSEITSVFDELADAFKDEPLYTNDPDRSDADTPLSILTLLKTFFDDDNWSYAEIAEDSALQLAFRGQHGRWNCYAKAREAQSQIVFYSIAPVVVSEEQLSHITKFIIRANSGLIVGNFELDLDDGEIRYKTSLDLEGLEDTILHISQSTNVLIQSIVYANVNTMDAYLPGIMAVLNEQLSPVDAIAQVEEV